jgi:hypothetical protein
MRTIQRLQDFCFAAQSVECQRVRFFGYRFQRDDFVSVYIFGPVN